MEITAAVSIGDFSDFRTLLDEMAAWDAIETRARGFDADALVRICYSDSAEDLLAQFTRPGAGLYLARQGGQVAGCAGFSGSEDGIGEVEKVFVRPGFRGLRLGATLVDLVLKDMAANGYRVARIETAEFMKSAIAIYMQHGFQRCPPFRAAMGDLGPMTVFMERGF